MLSIDWSIVFGCFAHFGGVCTLYLEHMCESLHLSVCGVRTSWTFERGWNIYITIVTVCVCSWYLLDMWELWIVCQSLSVHDWRGIYPYKSVKNTSVVLSIICYLLCTCAPCIHGWHLFDVLAIIMWYVVVLEFVCSLGSGVRGLCLDCGVWRLVGQPGRFIACGRVMYLGLIATYPRV